jgi:hypothetical protein
MELAHHGSLVITACVLRDLACSTCQLIVATRLCGSSVLQIIQSPEGECATPAVRCGAVALLIGIAVIIEGSRNKTLLGFVVVDAQCMQLVQWVAIFQVVVR